jgi:hypothetical protein
LWLTTPGGGVSAARTPPPLGYDPVSRPAPRSYPLGHRATRPPPTYEDPALRCIHRRSAATVGNLRERSGSAVLLSGHHETALSNRSSRVPVVSHLSTTYRLRSATQRLASRAEKAVCRIIVPESQSPANRRLGTKGSDPSAACIQQMQRQTDCLIGAAHSVHRNTAVRIDHLPENRIEFKAVSALYACKPRRRARFRIVVRQSAKCEVQ